MSDRIKNKILEYNEIVLRNFIDTPNKQEEMSIQPIKNNYDLTMIIFGFVLIILTIILISLIVLLSILVAKR
ncbi:hypothetical protein Catovirus_2_172 [Catovirus CTV1]|uniref:Uncharacterized protein n=1 Tax=Catovirus CTV1 TaxID=1977631 RepID=A0A1V0SBY3_9VIRU|nr:hypothetical protein Catovirus_2_172 [Catovirus CTV1]